MWKYDKKLEYPISIKNPNPDLAKLITSQFGGPHGELGASLRRNLFIIFSVTIYLSE